MIDKLAPRKQENNSYPALNDKIVMLENENKIIPILKKNISSLKKMNETIPKWYEKIEYLWYFWFDLKIFYRVLHSIF